MPELGWRRSAKILKGKSFINHKPRFRIRVLCSESAQRKIRNRIQIKIHKSLTYCLPIAVVQWMKTQGHIQVLFPGRGGGAELFGSVIVNETSGAARYFRGRHILASTRFIQLQLQNPGAYPGFTLEWGGCRTVWFGHCQWNQWRSQEFQGGGDTSQLVKATGTYNYN